MSKQVEQTIVEITNNLSPEDVPHAKEALARSWDMGGQAIVLRENGRDYEAQWMKADNASYDLWLASVSVILKTSRAVMANVQ